MPFSERYIWGVTAGILRNLYERIYAAMIRPVFTELVLFLAPFVALRALSGGDQGGVARRWRRGRRRCWPALGIVALVLMIGSFVYLAHFSGAPPGSTYEPAHVEDGKFVPGRMVR